MSLEWHRSENVGGNCKALIFRTCDLPNLSINEIDEDTVEFIQDDDLMFEVTFDSGVYNEPDNYDTNGTSFNFRLNITVAKDRIAQRQFEKRFRNAELQALILNKNNQWKYAVNLRIRSNLTSSRSESGLNNYSYTLFGNGTERAKFAIKEEASLILNTNWNEALDGAFTPAVTASLTGRYVFENGLEVPGNSISATGTGLDGTLQQVKFIISDFSTISSIDFINLKIVGTLNLELITFNTGSLCFLTNNPSLTNIVFSDSDNVINLLDVELCNLTGTFDLSNVRLNGSFVFRQNPLLTYIIHSIPALGQNVITGQYRGFACNIGQIDFNSFLFAPSASVILLENNNMSQPEVDAILAGIDAVAPSGSALINIDGTNSTPSGGLSNPNVISLISKGYTVTIS